MELSSKDLLSSVKKGFLIWSWLGLLAAYVSTSSVFSSQLYIIVTQGARGFKLTQYEYVGLGILFFPPIILAMGWFVFYRYSVFLLRETIAPLMDIEPDDENDKYLSKRFFFLFRSSILYLILSWVFMLFSVFFPYLISFTERI